MEVEYSVGLEDLLAFNEYHLGNSPTVRRQRRRVRLALPIALGLFWLLLPGIFHGTLHPTLWIILGVFLVPVAAFYFCMFPARVRQRTRRLVEGIYMEGQNRGLWGRRRLTITPETITEASEVSVTTKKWIVVEKIALDRQHAYFYVSAVSALILPKASFPSEADFHQFVETAIRYQRAAPT